MTQQLVQALALAPGPQTAAELRDALRRGGLKVEEFEVLQELRRMQNDGIVRLEGTRWRLLKKPASARITPSNQTTLSPTRPTASVVGATGPVPSSPIVAPPPAPAGRWALFRRFCHCYMDCLLQDEAPQLRAYVDNENDSWVALHGVPWSRLAAGGGLAVSLAHEQAPFQRNRVRRGAEDCVYLGYPSVLAKPNSTSGFVVPLFVQPMQAEWRSGVLHLEPDGPIAVNGAWLEYSFRRRPEREAFLRAMGFLGDVDAEDDNAERPPPDPKDFARLAQDAAHYVHDPEKYSQTVEPFVLATVAEWRRAEPGLYNVATLTLGPRLRYTRSLLRDLKGVSEKLSDEDLDRTALAALFPHDEPSGDGSGECESPSASPPASPGLPADQFAQTRLLHPSQRAAVANALTEKVSIVTGPPGTGKSEVVAVMLLNQLLRGQPTLFASKNHQALDAVLPRLNSATEGNDLIIQTSSRELAQRQNYLAKLQSLLARPPRPDHAQGDVFRERFSHLFGEQQATLGQISTLEKTRREYEALNARLRELRGALPHPAQSEEGFVLWPADVTRQRVEELEAELRASLARPSGFLQRIWPRLRRRQLEARRQAAREALRSLPVMPGDRALPDIAATVDAWNDLFATWRTWAEAANAAALVRSYEQRIAQLPRAEDCNGRLARAQQTVEELTQEWMAWAAGGVPSPLAPADRQALANLRAGIQNWGTDRFGKELRQHFPLILRAFPLWSVSNLAARSALPLVPGLFDLVIVDEASQCDIASVVPLLARSRRAVFAGDPMQLRHISNLDGAVEQALLEQYGLTDSQVQRFTYRVNSAFDLANDSESVPDTARTRLDLHFRSHELIADYCNEAFYQKTLHVVTATERLNIPRGVQPGIHWTHVAGTLESGPTGAWCADEIEAIRRELTSLASSGYRGSVGVVTPFRHQMIRLKDALETGGVLPPDFVERVRFMVSTAHGFQGDERDLILFSLCGGPDMPQGATIFLRENPNLFNVAVSRARAVLHIVGNRDWALNSGVSFIEKLARRSLRDRPTASKVSPEPYQSLWEKVLSEALQQAGVRVVPQYPIAGRFLDLAVLEPRKIDVEVDGESVHRTAGGGRKDDDHWRDLQLQSLGWQVCRFWVYEIREDLQHCTDRVISVLRG